MRSRSRQALGESLKRVIGLALCACMVSCALAPATLPESGVDEALASIDANDMLRHIRVLASDDFEGRAPGTPGEQLTVDYLIGQFKRLGLKPGNPDGTYVQKVPFVATRSRNELSLAVRGQRTELSEPVDFWAASAWQVPEDYRLYFRARPRHCAGGEVP